LTDDNESAAVARKMHLEMLTRQKQHEMTRCSFRASTAEPEDNRFYDKYTGRNMPTHHQTYTASHDSGLPPLILLSKLHKQQRLLL